jgi:hypothetical protein
MLLTRNGFRLRSRRFPSSYYVTPLIGGWPYGWLPDWGAPYFDDPGLYSTPDSASSGADPGYEPQVTSSESQAAGPAVVSSAAVSSYYAGFLAGQSHATPERAPMSVNQGSPGVVPSNAAPSTVPETLPATASITPPKTRLKPPSEGGPKYVLLSWLRDGGKDTVVIQNTETQQMQKVTTDPNAEHLRILELHPDVNPQLSAVVVGGGSAAPETVRFAPVD